MHIFPVVTDHMCVTGNQKYKRRGHVSDGLSGDEQPVKTLCTSWRTNGKVGMTILPLHYSSICLKDVDI